MENGEIDIKVVKGDIIDLQADVVVNVTYAGVTESAAERRIFQAFSSAIKQNLSEIQAKAKDEPGQVYHTLNDYRAGYLSAKQVFFVCLPDTGPAPATCNISNAINSTMLACLHEAEYYHQSIVFPVIGAELYPPDVIARCMFEAVLNYEEMQTSVELSPTLKTVIFAMCTGSEKLDSLLLETFTEQSQMYYEEPIPNGTDIETGVCLNIPDTEMDEIDAPFGLVQMQLRDKFIDDSSFLSVNGNSRVSAEGFQAEPDIPKLLTPPTEERPSVDNSGQQFIEKSSTERILPRILPSLSKKKRKKKRKSSINCQIIVGNIALQMADVIVCSVGESLNLSRAGASEALFKAGGKQLQGDLYGKYPNGCNPAEIATTIGTGSLQCEDVYCVILPKKENMKDLEKIVTSCLTEADSKKRRSLAFPALGTGKLKYSPGSVAKCMFESVRRFANSHRHTSVKTVMFVLQEKNKSVQEAFLQESKHNRNNWEEKSLQISSGIGQYPSNWKAMKNKMNEKVSLNEQNSEYKELKQRFLHSMPENTTVIKIERIQNMDLYDIYNAAKKAMIRRNPRIQNEKLLWHGTDGNVVESICINGFNRNYCGKNGTKYGDGTYFAKDSSYSNKYTKPDNNGHRHIFQTSVLTGRFITGERSMKEPPKLPLENQRFDSTVDDVDNPTIFVCFHDAYMYPQYLITYIQEAPDKCTVM